MYDPPEVGRSRRAKALAREAGFSEAMIALALPLDRERDSLLRWVESGMHGEMRWFTREHIERISDPESNVPGARSVLSVSLPYWAGPRPGVPRSGSIARYAWGEDYHAVMGERLERLAERLCAEFGGEHRWYVDAGRAFDRPWAVRSGLGWRGKNTNVLTREHGSFVLLGELVTTLELAPDEPIEDGCGACRLCLVACPTGALTSAYALDSRRCISYLTIEHRGPIAPELRPLMGAWVFGCDICQDVCPPSTAQFLTDREDRLRWSAYVRGETGGATARVPFGRASTGPNALLERRTARSHVDLHWLLTLTHADYLDAFRGTAIRRAKVWMLRRNAAIALGNTAALRSLGPLVESARQDDNPIVRGHAAWAIGRLGERFSYPVSSILRSALREEGDPEVREELENALLATPDPTP